MSPCHVYPPQQQNKLQENKLYTTPPYRSEPLYSHRLSTSPVMAICDLPRESNPNSLRADGASLSLCITRLFLLPVGPCLGFATNPPAVCTLGTD